MDKKTNRQQSMDRRLDHESGIALQHPFGGAYALLPRIDRYGLAKRPPNRLIGRFEDVMFILAIIDVDMQIHAALDGKGAKKLLGQSPVKGAVSLHGRWQMVDQIGSVGQINRHFGQGLVHGRHGKPVAPDTRSIPQGRGKGLSQNQSNILYRMMKIDHKVSYGLKLQVEAAMNTKKGQHVVKKTDSRLNLGKAIAIQIQLSIDPGLGRMAFDVTGAGHGAFSSKRTYGAGAKSAWKSVKRLQKRSFLP
ncbi:hypothetical protein DESC_290220 [Desulfosarcina cetonica]|nr:hypothetical protein DESC_290220 [Desulfosarcina cetonica]